MEHDVERSTTGVRRTIAALAVVAMCGVLLAVSTPAEAAPLEPPSPPAEGAWLGAFVNAGDGPSRMEAPELRKDGIAAYESQLGRRLDINHHFHAFDESDIVGPLEQGDAASGRIPLISWHGADTLQIVAGLHDGWIRRQAETVAALDTPVLIRWGWEMEHGRNSDWVRSPTMYIEAWKHLRSTFREAGATNASWVWCPQSISFGDDGRAPDYYPGDAHVDWICADGYNWAPGTLGVKYRPLAQIFADFYAWAADRGKPLMIGETGVQERAAGEKAAWFDDANHALQQQMPEVKALVYFDANARYDWRVSTSESSMQAFRNLAADPYWNTRSS